MRAGRAAASCIQLGVIAGCLTHGSDKTAKALGIAIPQRLLLHADEAIQ